MQPTPISDTFLPGTEPLKSLFRQVDWASSPVGEPSAWPPALRIALRFMLDSLDAVYLVWGPERTFFFNEAYIPILGPRLDQAMGSRFDELWADAWPAVAPSFMKAEAGQATKFDDMPVPMARYGEPEETWWTFSYTPIRDETGTVAGVICVTRETTKHVLEARGRAARERYNRQIIDSATDFAIIATGPDARITLWNKGAERVLGWSEEEVLGDVVDRIFTPEDRAAGRPQVEMKNALASGHANDERWHLKKDGERFWAQGEMTPLMHDGHAHGFVKVLRDRTPERLRQQRLDLLARASAGLLSSDDPDEVLQDILASGSDALGYDQSYSYLLNDDCSRMRLLHSEGATQEIRDWLQDAPVADVPLCGLVAQSREPLIISDVQRSIDARTERSRENGVRAYAGYPVVAGTKLYGVISFVSTTRDAFDDEALAFFDSFARFLSIGRERLDRELMLSDLAMTLEQRVKERTQALVTSEEALRQSQKMDAVGQLTGGVAHDFNNILTVIRGSVDLLRRDNLPADKRQRYLDAIADTSERATKLTNQLLAFARRQALSPETFNAGERIARIVEMLDRITGARIVIEQSMPGVACYIHADVSQFETAIINLAVNARDAMNGEGRLSITLRCQGTMPEIRGHASVNAPFAAIEIADTGVGIPANDIVRIFEPFFTTKTVGKGTGLGLSQVFGFAKQSGGDVDVTSEEGRGAAFTLYLPEVPAPADVRDDQATTPKNSHIGEASILVVEDNLEVGRFCVQVLEDLGYRSALVGNAEEALAVLQEQGDTFDVVFSDIVMPGMGGIELANRLRRDRPDLPVILASGYSHVLAEDSAHGFTLIQKPYSADQLSSVLQSALRS